MPKKPYRLRASDKNLTSKAGGIIRDMLGNTRKKFTASLPETFALFRIVTEIDHALEKATPGAKGDIKWHQAIRNVAKVHKKKEHNNKLMMAGELIALEEGGFALPGFVPKGRTSIEFPIDKGLDIKTAKKKRAIPKLKTEERERDPLPIAVRAEKVANRVRLLVREFDGDIRDAVVKRIWQDIEDGHWDFESRAKRRRGPTDEE